MTPTQRSLNYLRKEGWTPENVERYNAYTRKRKDLFGFIDIIAVRNKETLAVQTSSYSNMSARKKKILESELFETVKKAWKIVVHGWKKKKNGRYELKQYEL